MVEEREDEDPTVILLLQTQARGGVPTWPRAPRRSPWTRAPTSAPLPPVPQPHTTLPSPEGSGISQPSEVWVYL